MSWLLAIRSAASWICIDGFVVLCHRCLMTSAVAFTQLYLQMLKGPVGVSRGGLKTAKGCKLQTAIVGRMSPSWRPDFGMSGVAWLSAERLFSTSVSNPANGHDNDDDSNHTAYCKTLWRKLLDRLIDYNQMDDVDRCRCAFEAGRASTPKVSSSQAVILCQY